MSILVISCISLFCIFIPKAYAKKTIYKNMKLENTVTMHYSVSFEDVPSAKCAQNCASYPGCKLFHYGGNNVCYILNMVDKGLGPITISSLHVDQSLNERCRNQHGYLSFIGGIFCIKASSNKLDWTKANAQCEQDGGNLVILKRVELSLKLAAMKMLPSKNYWIGLNDISRDGKWVWVDGSTLDINIWYPGEPSNHDDEDCVRSFPPFILGDRRCFESYAFICEIPFMFTF